MNARGIAVMVAAVLNLRVGLVFDYDYMGNDVTSRPSYFIRLQQTKDFPDLDLNSIDSALIEVDRGSNYDGQKCHHFSHKLWAIFRERAERV
jgi:hypothetical protein